jgi:hypothetical protein
LAIAALSRAARAGSSRQQQQHQQKLQKQQINTTVDVLWEKTLHLMKCMEDEDNETLLRTHRQLLETTADDVYDANLVREMRMMGLGLLQKYQPMRLIFAHHLIV